MATMCLGGEIARSRNRGPGCLAECRIGTGYDTDPVHIGVSGRIDHELHRDDAFDAGGLEARWVDGCSRTGSRRRRAIHLARGERLADRSRVHRRLGRSNPDP